MRLKFQTRTLSAMSTEALGLIETKGMLGAIEVTRAATQAAEVSIASAEHTESGRVIVKIEGDWGAVVAAVDAGARAAEQAQQLVSMHVIPRPNEMVSPILPYQLFIDRYYPTGDIPRTDSSKADIGGSDISRPDISRPDISRSGISRSKPLRVSTTQPPASKPAPKPLPKPAPKPAPQPISRSKPPRVSTTRAAGEPADKIGAVAAPATVTSQPSHVEKTSPTTLLGMAELEAMPVVKLRQYARTLTNLPIQGRQISMANKQQLLEAIRAIL